MRNLTSGSKSMLSMSRYLLLFIVSVLTSLCSAQQLHNPVPSSYDDDMKRILILATSNHLYGISQGRIDRDSATLMASRIFGLSRLTAYNEGFSDGKNYPGKALIDSDNIQAAIQQLPLLQGDAHLQLLAELGLYYLHKSGSNKSDIDSAAIYITALYNASSSSTNKLWKMQGMWMNGELSANRDDEEKSNEYFRAATVEARAGHDPKIIATSLLYEAANLYPNDPEREKMLKEAIEICKKAQLPQMEYRVSIILLLDYSHNHPDRFLGALLEVLALEKKIGFLHHQYVNNSLAYWYIYQGDLVRGKERAEASLQDMAVTKDTVMSVLWYMRMAEIYDNSGNYTEAMEWNNRALNYPHTREMEAIWFKSVLQKIRILRGLERNKEALAAALAIYREFPPENEIDRMILHYNLGSSYESLEQDDKALYHYLQFIDISSKIPSRFMYGETLNAYNRLSGFYIKKGDYVSARKYANLILTDPTGKASPPFLAVGHHLLFKLDSIAGQYLPALKHYEQYHMYSDSSFSISQRKKMDELTVQYETKKKDQDIFILTQDSQLQKEKISRAAFVGNITLAGIVILLLFIGLLYNQYRLKQKANKETLAKNQILQQLVEEKEWLIREVHHRVKNNLQTIVSLLESQSIYLQDEALMAIQESQNRIHAMSLIHQKLYHEENISSVNMATYLPELAESLSDSYNTGNKISFQLQVEDIELDVSQAIPLGLVVNEAVTNAIKYAFPHPQAGNSISITFVKETDFVAKLKIRDNGVGIAPDILNRKAKGLGLKLINGLAKDIDAELCIQSDGGTSISLAFAVNQPLHSTTATTPPFINVTA